MSSRYLKSITRNNRMKFSGGNAGGILITAPDLDTEQSPKGQRNNPGVRAFKNRPSTSPVNVIHGTSLKGHRQMDL